MKFYKSCNRQGYVATFKITEEDDMYHLECLDSINTDLFEVGSFYYVPKDKLTKEMNGYLLSECSDEESVLLNIKHGGK